MFSPGQKKSLTFPIPLFLFIIANCYVDRCEPRNRVPILKEISRERSPLNNYLPAQ